MKNTASIAQYSMLIALALILSYVEAQIPALLAIPGMKLGLTNIVVLFALYRMDYKCAMSVNLLRILLVSFLFGNAMSLAYSIAGGMLSTLIMILLKKTEKFSIVAVSVSGGIFHNIGQILVAMILLETTSVAWYFLVLWFTGIISGLIVGFLSGQICYRLN
jgi:heptaprenyl diphosphate synthase